MPTATEVQASQMLRARFLAALWDAEANGMAESDVRQVLTKIGVGDLPAPSEYRLVRTLVDDRLIEDSMPRYAPSPTQVRLTASGRAEVERWTTAPAEPTEHLPVTHQTVFNTTFNGPVHGSSLVQGSQDVQVTFTGGDIAQVLQQFVQAYQAILQQLLPGEQEAAEADLDTLSEQAGTGQPALGRVKPLLNRLMGWAAAVAVNAVTSGASTGAQTELDRLGHQALSLLS